MLREDSKDGDFSSCHVRRRDLINSLTQEGELRVRVRETAGIREIMCVWGGGRGRARITPDHRKIIHTNYDSSFSAFHTNAVPLTPPRPTQPYSKPSMPLGHAAIFACGPCNAKLNPPFIPNPNPCPMTGILTLSLIPESSPNYPNPNPSPVPNPDPILIPIHDGSNPVNLQRSA